MLPLKYPLIRLLTWMLAGGPLHAQLKWDCEKVELTTAPTDAHVDGKFGFMNAGKTAVTIESVQSSCGCTVPTLEKKSYAPGERGELLAHFLVGDRRGVQNQTILVKVNGERDPTLLTLVVKIPEILRITPLILTWEEGEAPNPKTFTLQSEGNQAVRVQKVTCANAGFSVNLASITEAKEYQVSVMPRSTDQPDFALVTIEALVMEKPKSFPAYVQIRRRSR